MLTVTLGPGETRIPNLIKQIRGNTIAQAVVGNIEQWEVTPVGPGAAVEIINSIKICHRVISDELDSIRPLK